MKNKFRNLFLVLLVMVFLPLTTFLTACGATPSKEVKGIKFETMTYDKDTGYAVFEVDKNVTTDLTYKIYPSSGSSYKVYFDPIDKGTAENSSRFTFKDGKITVTNDNFEDVTYKVRVKDYSDICIIRLKEYPVEIFTDTTSLTISTFDVKAINVKARYKNSTVKNITEKDYDFLVETTNETIVDVPNKNRLKYCAVRNGSSSAKVTVKLLNKAGEETGLEFQIDVNVIQNVSEGYVIASGTSSFVYDGDEVDIDFNALNNLGTQRELKFDIYLLNSSNLIIGNECNYSIYLSSKKYLSVSNDGKYLLIQNTVEDGYEVDVRIVYNNLKKVEIQDGERVSSSFIIDLKMIINK